MATLQSVRPYVIRDGKSWCASCGRRRLCKIVGTRFVACPACDYGQPVRTSRGEVTITGGEILCARCNANSLVVAGPMQELECPACDTPPWERESVGQPSAVQLLIPGTADTPPADGETGPDGAPPRPQSVVRACFYCAQTTWQDYYWRLNRWRAICRGCGNRLQASRVKVTRAKKGRRDRG